MVYNLYSDGIGSEILISSYHKSSGRKYSSKSDLPINDNNRNLISSESLFASFLIKFIKLFLIVYDTITLPIYFLLQRPDFKLEDSFRTKSERVEINTWIKTDQNSNEFDILHGLGRETNYGGISNRRRSRARCSKSASTRVRNYKFMGSTLNLIFANAIKEYKTKPCLGYRALVTCPVLAPNNDGSGGHSLQEKSFRSDYTWYTYEQVGRRVQDIASGLYHHSVWKTKTSSRAFFFANTSLEWFLTAQACFQLTTVQLVVAPEISDIKTIIKILIEAEISILFVSCDKLTKLCQLFEHLEYKADHEGDKSCRNLLDQLKKIILIDWLFSIDYTEQVFAKLRFSSDCMVEKLISLGQIEEAGVENPIQLNCTNFLEEISTIQDKLSMADKISIPTRRLRGDMGKKDSGTSKGTNCLRATDSSNLPIVKASDLAMIVYSYAKLGQIRAVMLNHSHLARCNNHLFLDGLLNGNDVHCTTLALDNMIEFMTELCLFSHGGSIGYSSNNSKTLFYDGKDLFERDLSDLEALNPTFLLVRPYVLESLRASIQNYLNFEYNQAKNFLLLNLIYDYKKYWAHRQFDTPIVNWLFCLELRKLFGTKLKFILCNGATDCSETKDFFAFIVNLPVIELYGPDEAMASLISVNNIWDHKRRIKSNIWSLNNHSKASGNDLNTDDDNNDDETLEDFPELQLMPPKKDKNIFRVNRSKNLLTTSSILCPTLGTRIQLEDWEDFKTSDLPYPRGRLILGGDVVCAGHFNRQINNNYQQNLDFSSTDISIKSSKTFYRDSNLINWFRTDDIVRVFPNGSLEIISGLSDIIRLSDGQLISLSQIEHILRNSQFVDNVCAICDGEKRFVIALVVPNLRRLALKSPGQDNLKMAIGMEPEPDELLDIEFRREVCNDRLLCEFVEKHLIELVANSGFHCQTISTHFYLVPEIWTPENELVTPSFEPKRAVIQNLYANDIQSIIKMKFERSNKRLSSRVFNYRKIRPQF